MARSKETPMLDVMLPSPSWLTPAAVAEALGATWAALEERDIDSVPPPADTLDERAYFRARHARRNADIRTARRVLREATPSERVALLSVMLSPSLDLSDPRARRFATAVFEEASPAELSPAALVRGLEAAARTGRDDLVARSRDEGSASIGRALLLLDLVAARLERRGEYTAARLLRRR